MEFTEGISEDVLHFERSIESGLYWIWQTVERSTNLEALRKAIADIFYSQKALGHSTPSHDCILGLCYEKLGNKELAEKHYLAVQEKQSKYQPSEEVLFFSAEGLQRLQNRPKITQMVERGWELFETKIEAFWCRQALFLFTLAQIRAEGPFFKLEYGIIRCLEKMNWVGSAIISFEQILVSYPKLPPEIKELIQARIVRLKTLYDADIPTIESDILKQEQVLLAGYEETYSVTEDLVSCQANSSSSSRWYIKGRSLPFPIYWLRQEGILAKCEEKPEQTKKINGHQLDGNHHPFFLNRVPHVRRTTIYDLKPRIERILRQTA